MTTRRRSDGRPEAHPGQANGRCANVRRRRARLRALGNDAAPRGRSGEGQAWGARRRAGKGSTSMTESDKLDGADLSGIAYGRTEGWDSVAHMQLVAAIENALGIMIETDDVIAMSDYAAVTSILREHHGIALEP